MSVLILGGYYGAATATGNFHEVVPHRIYRSGQPSAEQLRAWIDRYNLKTIIILRGREGSHAAEEDAVARSMGADVVILKLSAYVSMPSDKLVQLIEILEGARQPILLHCRHGVDRAGTASAIAAWLVGSRTFGFAKWQAYMPPGPWKNRKGKGHISDVLTFYEDYCREQGLSPNDPSLFKYWARNVYSSDQSPAATDDPAE
jgi:rhodanese-related sulfurtransferase